MAKFSVFATLIGVLATLATIAFGLENKYNIDVDANKDSCKFKAKKDESKSS